MALKKIEEENKKKAISSLRLIIFILGLLIGVYLVSFTIGESILKGTQPTLSSFLFIHFAGYLFFILAPVELLFLHLIRLDFNPFLLTFFAILTAMSAQLIDYIIGHFVSRKFILNILGKKRYKKAKKEIDKYGNLTIFLFNLFPLSSPIIALVAGMIRYKLRSVLFYSFIGLLIKYIVISIIFS